MGFDHNFYDWDPIIASALRMLESRPKLVSSLPDRIKRQITCVLSLGVAMNKNFETSYQIKKKMVNPYEAGPLLDEFFSVKYSPRPEDYDSF
jgi:hypothetical protein